MQQKIYKKQTDLVLNVTTGVNFNTYPPLKVSLKYIDPNDKIGEWFGTVDNEASGSFTITFNSSTKFMEAGKYKVQPVYYATDGKIACGDLTELVVSDSLL